MSQESIVNNILQSVYKNETEAVDKTLKSYSKEDRTPIKLCTLEQSLSRLEHTILRTETYISKLLQYGVSTISAFHLAALLGRNDILVTMMDFVRKPDATLKSGATPLILASFADRRSTVKLLLSVYKANINLADGYGWTALHYAATEGHLHTVQLLVDANAKVDIRDKDGTTAAFRAQIYGHEHVVTFLQCVDEKNDLLKIKDNNPEMHTLSRQTSLPESPTEKSQVKPGGKSSSREKMARKSSRQISAPHTFTSDADEKSKLSQISQSNLPNPRSTVSGYRLVRRIIRNQLHASFGENAYELPCCCVKKEAAITRKSSHDQKDEPVVDSSFCPLHFNMDDRCKAIGPETLRIVLRDEIEELRKQLLTGISDDPLTPGLFDPPDNIVGTLGPPPLPPRNANPTADSNYHSMSNQNKPKTVQETDKPILSNKSVALLATYIGKNWKSVARGLPLASSKALLDETIALIEREHPDDPNKQAFNMLQLWQSGTTNVSVEVLGATLNRCGLHKASHILKKKKVPTATLR